MVPLLAYSTTFTNFQAGVNYVNYGKRKVMKWPETNAFSGSKRQTFRLPFIIFFTDICWVHSEINFFNLKPIEQLLTFGFLY
jgi:hypothetical protein